MIHLAVLKRFQTCIKETQKRLLCLIHLHRGTYAHLRHCSQQNTKQNTSIRHGLDEQYISTVCNTFCMHIYRLSSCLGRASIPSMVFTVSTIPRHNFKAYLVYQRKYQTMNRQARLAQKYFKHVKFDRGSTNMQRCSVCRPSRETWHLNVFGLWEQTYLLISRF